MTDSPGQNTTDGPPVHIFEMTSSQTPDKIYNQRLNKISMLLLYNTTNG